MHIGIDVSSSVDPRPSGVARYICRLVASLEELPDPPHVTLYCRISRRRLGHPGRLLASRAVQWWSGAVPPRGIDVFHAPDLRMPRWNRRPVVVTIHDLSALERDDHASASFLARKRRAYRRAARAADAIITHTEAVRARLIDVLAIDAKRVTTIPLAAALPASAPEATSQRGARLLLVGGPSVRKGSPRLAPLLRFWESRLGWKPELDWVGSGSSEQIAEARTLLPAPFLERVRFLGHVSDAMLDGLYRTALGLLVISDTEGFGMPLLEAATRGCPILALASDTLREVMDGNAFWFGEPIAASEAVFREFLDERERSRRAASAAERSRTYEWERTARATADVYRKASQRRG